MDKAILKKTQPTVYRILSRALKNRKVSHAYLFCGPASAPKAETALLFTQSLVCPYVDEDGFACQTCSTCKRYENEGSFDLIHLKDETIKKKQILQIQQTFSSTSIQEAYRIYILEHFDRCTPEASNTLLKFLEEPQPGIVGLLIVNDLSSVLDTIQSRTQVIQFRPLDRMGIQNELEAASDPEKARMLALSGLTLLESRSWIEKEEFADLQEAALQYIQDLGSMGSLYKIQKEIFYSKSKYREKEFVLIWLKWVLYYIKYTDRCQIDQKKKNEIFMILIETIDRLQKPVDLGLTIDQLHYRIRKVIKL